jgi:hypothetical protein
MTQTRLSHRLVRRAHLTLSSMSYQPLLIALFALASLNASVIGTSKPADSITAERIAALPAHDRAAWSAYLDRSNKKMLVDRAALAAERTPGGLTPPLPKEGRAASSIPLDRDPAWYRSAEARHIADVIVSFQAPAGGWSKNLDLSGDPRARGQSYAPDNLNKHPIPGDFDTPRDPGWNYVGTLDNDATTTELQFLARVAEAASPASVRIYRTSFLKGIRYLLSAQFPNGGWPQVWPLQGGYHDAVTYNDNAFTHAAELMTTVASGAPPYSFVPAALRHQASLQRHARPRLHPSHSSSRQRQTHRVGAATRCPYASARRRSQLRARLPLQRRTLQPAPLPDAHP